MESAANTTLGNEGLAPLECLGLGAANLAPGAVVQSLDDAIVGRVLGEVVEPEIGLAIAGEHTGNPAELYAIHHR
jgi:hypothetical protein